MPAEIRHVLFRAAEVVAAVRDHRVRLKNPLPRGSVIRCGVMKGSGEVRFSMAIGDETAQQTVTVDGASLAAALILYCRDRRIPLPSDAEKELRRIGDTVMLVVTRNPTGQPLPRMELVVAREADPA